MYQNLKDSITNGYFLNLTQVTDWQKRQEVSLLLKDLCLHACILHAPEDSQSNLQV